MRAPDEFDVDMRSERPDWGAISEAKAATLERPPRGRRAYAVVDHAALAKTRAGRRRMQRASRKANR